MTIIQKSGLIKLFLLPLLMPKCPVCNRPKSVLKHKIHKYSYYNCSTCKSLFLHPLPTNKQISKYYLEEFNYKAGIQNEERIRTRSKIVLKKLKKLNSQGKSLLDIGSGFGFFLDEARKVNLEILGVEPSKYLSVQSFKRLDLLVVNTDFDSFLKSNIKNKFDFITMIHVIEHLQNPNNTIHKVMQLLNKNGILYIETPNYHSWLQEFEKEKYTFLTPPQHVILFSAQSLSSSIKMHTNLIIKKISTYSYPEHFMGILKICFNKKYNPAHKLETKTYFSINTNTSFNKKVKYILFDKILSSLFYLLLDIGNKGSILELYSKKPS